MKIKKSLYELSGLLDDQDVTKDNKHLDINKEWHEKNKMPKNTSFEEKTTSFHSSKISLFYYNN